MLISTLICIFYIFVNIYICVYNHTHLYARIFIIMYVFIYSFQERVNSLCGSDSLKFTMEIWNPDAPESEKPRNNKRVKIVRNQSFPYLDAEMHWKNDDLFFGVHKKPNQLMKYVNMDSTRTKACRKSVPHGVIRRLSLLTS